MAPAVLDTLRLTYTFLVTHALTLLRLTWFPMLILALSDVFFTARLLPFFPAIQSGNATEVANSLLPSLGFIALGLVVPLVMSATAATGILRFVILGEGAKNRSWLHFAVGAPVLRVAGTTLLLSAILILVALVIAFVVLAVAVAVPGAGSMLPIFIFVGLTAIGSRWLMAYPSAAIGGRIDLEAAWALTKPVYARLLILVLIVVGLIGLVSVASGVFESLIITAHGTSTADVAKGLSERWPFVTVLSFISNLFAATSFFTLLGIVYRLQMRERERPATRLQPAPHGDEPAP